MEAGIDCGALRRIMRRLLKFPSRIVLDTNVLVAARWKPESASARLIQGCIEHCYINLFSTAIRSEQELIVAKIRPPDEFKLQLNELYKASKMIRPKKQFFLSDDPDDNKYLDCAVAGGASAIISSDRHLTALNGWAGIEICSAGAFLNRTGA